MSPFRRTNPLLIGLIWSLLLVHLPLFLILFFCGGKTMDGSDLDVMKQHAIVVDLKRAGDLPIVDIPKPHKQEKPDKASVQALYDSKAERETVSNGRKPQAKAAPQAKKPAVAKPRQMPLPQREPPTAPKRSEPAVAKQEAQAPLPAKRSLQDELRALKGLQLAKESQELKKFASKTAMSAPPTNFDGGGGSEFLPDYKIGDRTYVNALANPQIAYYVELKRKFKLTWNPVPALRAQINQITKGKVTVVMGVSLDASGKLAELQVLRGSGLSGYDAEAKRTVKASAPFSQPPAGLLQKDGQMHMAWTFVVYL